MTPINFTTPVGRFVQGNLYEPRTTDFSGQPLLIKTGPSKGQPRKEWYVALAIPKEPGKHWAATEWGGKIWQVGHAFRPNASQLKDFAWKVVDGDSTQIDKSGTAPCNKEGFPGNWILRMSSGFAPRLYTLIGQQEATALDAPGAINPGDYLQVNCTLDGNGSDQSPGVFVNMSMVCLVGYGQRIVFGPDVKSAGFGGQPLPAGASLTPQAGFTPPVGAPAAAPTAPGLPPAPPVPGAPAALPPGPPAAAASPVLTAKAGGASYADLIAKGWNDALLIQHGLMLAPVVAPPPLPAAPVVPNPAILVPPVPGVPAVPPAPPARVMTAAAQGASYADLIAKGWTDALLVQHGLMLP